MNCPKCNSIDWDWANIGLTDAKHCLDCGEIYFEKESKMKTYKVLASSTTYYTLVIEAEDDEHAWQLAKEADGGDFDRAKGWDADWHISSVDEVVK